MVDGDIVAAAQEERFTRRKHDHSFPVHAIRYCLDEAGIAPETLDYVGFYDKPFLNVRRQLLLPVGVNYFCRLRGSEISIEEGDACVACGRRLRRPKRGGKRASSTASLSPERSRAFSTPLAGCTGPREFGSRTDHRAGTQRARSRPRTRSKDCRRGHARFRTADAQELAKSVGRSGRIAWLRNRGTMRSGCP